jgi:hypothetical protein
VALGDQCPGGGPGGPRISNPFRFAIWMSRCMGGAVGCGRQDALGGRLADLALESLELHRREADERPCSTVLGVEGVRYPLGPNAKRAGLQRQSRVGWVEENFTGLLTDGDIKAITRGGSTANRPRVSQ